MMRSALTCFARRSTALTPGTHRAAVALHAASIHRATTAAAAAAAAPTKWRVDVRHCSNYGGGGGDDASGDSVSTVLTVPRDQVGFLIGRGGASARLIEEKSMARLQFGETDPDTDSTEATIVVNGTADAVAAAVELVNASIEQLMVIRSDKASWDERSDRGDIITQTLDIPNVNASTIIGRRGESINVIRDASQAKINISRDGDPRIATVEGTPEAVAVALEMLTARVDELAAAHAGATKIEIPTALIGGIFGRGGTHIQMIQRESNANVNVAEDVAGVGVRVASVTGTPEAIDMAIEMLNARIEELQDRY
eukprot:m.324678 g.324678  ORF g.324678 m.324678 type:complete len:312 (-) comp27634_c0_seq1:266-1201(-)